MNMQALEPREDVEQICLFRWAAYQTGKYPMLAAMFHIPNGGKRGKAEAARFKAMGVKPGVSDIFLPWPAGGKHGLWIELKRVTMGRLTDEERDWLDTMRAWGYAAECCHGWEAATKVILDYLSGE